MYCLPPCGGVIPLCSCFWFEKLELQSGTRAPIDMDKKPRLRKLLNGAEDKRVQSYAQEVEVRVRCFPKSFTAALEVMNESVRVTVQQDLGITAKGPGLDEKLSQTLGTIAEKSGSLVLCVHYWCKSKAG